MGCARSRRISGLITPRPGQGRAINSGTQLARQERLRVRELREPGPDVITGLFETGEPLIEVPRVGQDTFEVLELAASAPPGDSEPDGADGSDLGRREEETEARTR